MTLATQASAPVVLVVGTRKGLFRLHAPARGGDWDVDGPHIAGYEVLHACVDRTDPAVVYAAASHPIWGSHIYRSADGGETWAPLPQAPHHDPSSNPTPLKRIWYITRHPDGRLLAGIDPPGLFTSADEGESWQPVVSLNEHPSRKFWEPARGGFSVHSIYVAEDDPNKIFAAVSAGGVYRSTDGGRTWQTANAGVRAENLPTRFPDAGHNIHRLVMHPRRTNRLYRQCYNGAYRSDDGGRSWTEITAGLPGDFGYAIAVSPYDPDTVFQIPEASSHMRTVVDGRLRVFRSRDGGASWAALERGLPQRHAYVTVLREALTTDMNDPCGVFFGTSSGHVFASHDEGERWQIAAAFLPRILCVKAITASAPRS